MLQKSGACLVGFVSLPDCSSDVSLPGFYGVTYMKGFRDKFNVDIEAILNLICSYILSRPPSYAQGAHILVVELERNIDPRESRVTFEELRFAAAHTTHLFVYPNCSLQSTQHVDLILVSRTSMSFRNGSLATSARQFSAGSGEY